MVAGAAVTAVAAHAVAGALLRPPAAALGVLAAITAVAAAGLVPNVLPTSHWMVPQRWLRMGPTAYPAAFAAVLGAGFVTVVASTGYYAALASTLVLPPWWQAVLVFGTFGLARSVPFAIGSLRATRDGRGVDHVERLGRIAERFGPLEAALLAAVAAAFLR